MEDLLFNHNLVKSTPGADVSQLAKVPTLTTLRRLDAYRNRIVLQFLQDAGLIRTGDAINLSNADLSNDFLSGANLSGVNLDGANLKGADLRGVNLSNASLNNAGLSNDFLNGANLRGVNLDGTTLTGAHLNDANLNGAALDGVNLNGADLRGAKLSNASLSNANLSNEYLSGANLRGVNLDGTTLTGAHLNDANLNGAVLHGVNLNGADLRGAKLSNASLFYVRLNAANLSGAHLDGAVLQGADLGYADLNHVILTSASLNGTILIRARLDGAYMSGAKLINVYATDSDFNGADLTGAYLIGPVLSQQQLDSVYSCTYATLAAGLRCRRQPTINLTYWYTESPAEVPVIHELIRQFERHNPKIHINAINKNYYQAETDFENSAEAGKAPDVLRSDVSWIAQLASQSYLLNIDRYIPQNDLSDYLATPLGYDHYDGHLYGLPQVTDFLALLYNKAELENAGITPPPRNMAELEADAMKVVRTRKAAYGFETDGTGYNALPFLYAFGGGTLNLHNNIIVNDTRSVEGLNFLLKLQNTDKVMPANGSFSNGSFSPMITDFMTGKTAMIFGGPYNIPEILTGPSFKGNPSNLGIAGIPTGPAGQAGSPSGGQSYVISAGTLHPSDAYKFISFMSSALSQIEIAEATHTLPTRQSAYQDNGIPGEQVISEFRHIESTAVLQPHIPQAAHLFDAFDPNIAAALDGVESSTAALNAVANAWGHLLAAS